MESPQFVSCQCCDEKNMNEKGEDIGCNWEDLKHGLPVCDVCVFGDSK